MIKGNGNEKAKRKDKYTAIEAATSIFKAEKNTAALTKDNKHIKLIHFFFFFSAENVTLIKQQILDGRAWLQLFWTRKGGFP